MSVTSIISRRACIAATLATAAAATTAFAESPATQPTQKKIDKGPPIEPALIKQFVGAGHADLDGVKQMLAERPNIVNGVWDWGGGDFETALGGAAHMGRPDIVQYLLDHDARMDLFAAAVLNRIDIIKAAVAAWPQVHKVPGPHGISLMAHAKRADAEKVIEFLETL